MQFERSVHVQREVEEVSAALRLTRSFHTAIIVCVEPTLLRMSTEWFRRLLAQVFPGSRTAVPYSRLSDSSSSARPSSQSKLGSRTFAWSFLGLLTFLTLFTWFSHHPRLREGERPEMSSEFVPLKGKFDIPRGT